MFHRNSFFALIVDVPLLLRMRILLFVLAHMRIYIYILYSSYHCTHCINYTFTARTQKKIKIIIITDIYSNNFFLSKSANSLYISLLSLKLVLNWNWTCLVFFLVKTKTYHPYFFKLACFFVPSLFRLQKFEKKRNEKLYNRLLLLTFFALFF